MIFPRQKPDGTSLFICPSCHVAAYHPPGEHRCEVARCQGRPDGPPVLRKATKAEATKAATKLAA